MPGELCIAACPVNEQVYTDKETMVNCRWLLQNDYPLGWEADRPCALVEIRVPVLLCLYECITIDAFRVEKNR